jgi:hypothetical protein
VPLVNETYAKNLSPRNIAYPLGTLSAKLVYSQLWSIFECQGS